MTNFVYVLTRYYLNDEMKNEIGWACGMCGGEVKMYTEMCLG
jgi:hypothetical protein